MLHGQKPRVQRARAAKTINLNHLKSNHHYDMRLYPERYIHNA